jgi:hypothetical protein
VIEFISRDAHFLRLAHKLLKYDEFELPTVGIVKFLVEPIKFRSFLQQFDKPPKILEVQIIPILVVSVLSTGNIANG